MKVKELIEILEKCDKELDVYTMYNKDNIFDDYIDIVDIAQITMTKDNDCVVIIHEYKN